MKNALLFTGGTSPGNWMKEEIVCGFLGPKGNPPTLSEVSPDQSNPAHCMISGKAHLSLGSVSSFSNGEINCKVLLGLPAHELI